MRPLLTVGLLFLSLNAFSEPTAIPIGEAVLYVPLTALSASYQWDFIHKRNLLGVETPVAKFRALTASVGGASAFQGRGIFFGGVHISFANPENFLGVNALHPGVFVGYSSERVWLFSTRLSLTIF